jgi:NTP pyrophosphatase (non-canonical NTP hydrolase)
VTLDDYQTAAARTLNPRLTDGERMMDAAAGLAEEGGEVLSLVRKHLYQNHPLDRESLAKELGDALWCLAAVAREAGLDLGTVASANLEKLRRRYPEGYSDEKSRERSAER